MLQPPVGRGFLPEKDPLAKLPSSYEPLEEIVSNLPEFYTDGSIRERIKKLPELPVAHLDGQLLEAVMRDIHFVTAAYYHARGHEPPNYFPSNIARPAYYAAKKFDKEPILSYCSYALNNWSLRFDERGFEPDNINILRKFIFTRDEEWFILIHVAIEAEAQNILKAIVAAYGEKALANPDDFEDCLVMMGIGLERLYRLLARMREQCQPKTYAAEVRIPIMMQKEIVFEGVPELKGRPITLLGETGAQSSIVPSVVAALCVQHQEEGHTRFLREHRNYMPPAHRKFIFDIEALSSVAATSIRGRAINIGRVSLKASYNFARAMLHKFREEHFRFAQDYIFSQLPPEQLMQYGGHTGQKEEGHKGTGGTVASKWLPKLRDETAADMIPLP